MIGLSAIHLLSTLALIYVGMMSINLSADKPFKNIFNRKITNKESKILYWLGWLFILFSVPAVVSVWGMTIGIAAWFGIATVVVGILIYIQAYQPKWAWYLSLSLIVLVIALQIIKVLL